MREEWKNIADGNYQISNLGRIKSVERYTTNGRAVHERILKTRVNDRGYEYTNIQFNGNRKAIKIHREVAKAFIDNPNGYLEVNHKDENKTNNRVDNLEWCDRSYNVNYGTAIQRAVIKREKRHFKEINQYTLDGVFVKRWRYSTQIEKATNKAMRATNIISCCRGKYKSSYGFIWRYANDEVNHVTDQHFTNQRLSGRGNGKISVIGDDL